MSSRRKIDIDLTALAGLFGVDGQGALVDPHPGVEGRWQPTRAGAVNSWQWASEQFLFRNGWLGLVGRNGSGKSLTGSTLFPTFMDGDVSQKGLAVSGRAGSTLTQRHTSWKTSQPKTGMWWQEFGHTEGQTGHDDATATHWVTIGLWLRSSGSDRAVLERGWFIAPGRVDQDLVFERDRTPIDIDDLAQQLADLDGQFFTSHERLHRAASKHLSIVLAEEAFTEAIRKVLYAPLDSDQMNALANVLRALRSIQVNDRVSPEQMKATLSSALPALDVDRVRRLAEALAKAEQMRTRLEAAKKEHDSLAQVSSGYRRYVAAVTALVSTSLVVANREYASRLKERESLTTELDSSQRIQEDSARKAEDLTNRLNKIEATIELLQNKARGHAGARLDELRQHVAELTHVAANAQAETEKTQELLNLQQADSEERDSEAADSSAALRTLLSHIAHDSGELFATAYFDTIEEVSASLCASSPTLPVAGFEDRVEHAQGAFFAWADDQLSALQAVVDAITEHRTACATRDATDQRYASAQAAADTAATALQQAADASRRADNNFLDQLLAFADSLTQLPRPPDVLLDTELPGFDAITRWADRALAKVLGTVDVPGAESRAKAAREAAHRAQQTADQATAEAMRATATASDQAINLIDAAAPLGETPSVVQNLAAALTETCTSGPDLLPALHNRIDAAAEDVRRHLVERQFRLRQATALLTSWVHAKERADRDAASADSAEQESQSVRQQAEAASAAAHAAATAWIAAVYDWADDLQFIDHTQLQLPNRDNPTSVDPTHLKSSLEKVHREAANTLTAEHTTAQAEASSLRAQLADLTTEITATARTEPRPDSPSWRTPRTHRAGAPLWALVDFAAGVPTHLAGQLEGGLLAAGILDAWVSADGDLTEGDVHLRAGEPLSGTTLADLLVPERDCAVPAHQVHALLSSIRVTEPDADDDPLNPLVFQLGGVVRSGALHAVSPADWSPQHIGATARERNRQRRIAQLRARHAELSAAYTVAADKVRQAADKITRAHQEANALPPTTELMHHRDRAAAVAADAARLHQTARTIRTTADESAGLAEQAWSATTDACVSARVEPNLAAVESATDVCAQLAEFASRAEFAGKGAVVALIAANEAAVHATELHSCSQDADSILAEARRIADEAQRERDKLPSATDAHNARQSAQTSRHEAELALAFAADVRTEFDRCEQAARSAFTQLNTVARARGRLLPTDHDTISNLRRRLTTLRDDVGTWTRTAERTHALTNVAQRQRTATEQAKHRHREAQERAKQAKATMQQAQHRIDEEVRLHERPYRELLNELEQQRHERDNVQTRIAEETQSARAAEIASIQTRGSLDRAEERLNETGERRATSLADLQLLFDQEFIVELEQHVNLPRPETVPQGIETARHLAGTRDGKSHPDTDARREAVDRALRELDPRVRRVRDQLVRLGRHLQLEDVPGGWKRITITEQSQPTTDFALNGTNTKPLRVALKDLERSIRTLESDFNEQVRIEIKGAVFTELRKHISVRIDLAEQIVEDIRTTLASVRTGVARVGVRLSWQPRDKDPIAQEAISLIRKPDRAGAFDRMYEFFVHQFVEPAGAGSEADAPSWMEQVFQVFDYRNWYDWEIHLTHADFADSGDGEPVFRAVTSRQNPLEVLSAGEKRLATMLPMLAAIRAFYSVKDYHGPRMIFIDELNAAFDAANLRMVLALLRTWDFDVLATLPSTSPLLVAETGSIAIHEIMAQQEGVRFSIPCIWDGTGQPATARIVVGNTPSVDMNPVNTPQDAPLCDGTAVDS